MNQKILIFSLAYFPHIGGAEVAIQEITARVRDFSFDLVTLRLDKNDAKSERVGNVNVYRIGCLKFLFPFYAYLEAKKLHKRNNYQIVWGMMANLAGLAALFFKLKHRSVKFLLTLQTGNDDKKVWQKTWWWRWLYKKIYKKADYIQAISNYLANRARRMGVKCPVAVVPNGVDLEKFTAPTPISSERSEDPEQRRGTISPITPVSPIKRQDEKIIITTSRLVEKNGIADLIRAVSQLPASPTSQGGSIINYQLLIVGTGELEDSLRTLVDELNLESRVTFLGQIKHEDLPKYYQMADVFARPSLSEGLGISFLEAMASGVPTIGTRVGGIPDFLENGVTGWFCEKKNPKSIAEKINYVLNKKNKEEVERVAKNAKRLVLEKYNWDNIAKKMGEIFHSLSAL